MSSWSRNLCLVWETEAVYLIHWAMIGLIDTWQEDKLFYRSLKNISLASGRWDKTKGGGGKYDRIWTILGNKEWMRIQSVQISLFCLYSICAFPIWAIWPRKFWNLRLRLRWAYQIYVIGKKSRVIPGNGCSFDINAGAEKSIWLELTQALSFRLLEIQIMARSSGRDILSVVMHKNKKTKP